MRIAIFHNFMDNIGGAEVVTLTLARELNGDIYTTNINTDHIKEMGFEDIIPRIFSIGKIPLQAPWRHQLAFWRFRHLNLKDKYDFYIISGDWAMSGAVLNKPNLWYVHSPLHELWAFKDWIRNTMVAPWKRPAYDLWVWFNRKLTLSYAKHIKNVVANSINTQERVKKYYSKEAVVINPPINTNNFKFKMSGDYWLSVNRIVKHKRIEIQVDAFRKMPNEKLIIVGSYEKNADQFEEYKDEIERALPKNIKILNWVTSEELRNLYANCKGFITTSKAEDFGMTAVEAMSAGKAVIAPNEGGYKETIIHGRTGVLIESIDSEKLAESIRKISHELEENPNRYKNESENHASQFDTSVFIKKIKAVISCSESKK